MNLFRGKHILPGSTEDFDKICKKIGGSFTGVMRFLGGYGGEFYQADLLVRNGNIVAASFEDLSKRTITFKENAINEIKKKLIGSAGTLDVYVFDEEDIRIAMMNNNEAILESYSPQISLSTIGIKIKPMKMNVLETPKEETKVLEIGPKKRFNFRGILGIFTGVRGRDMTVERDMENLEGKQIGKMQQIEKVNMTRGIEAGPSAKIPIIEKINEQGTEKGFDITDIAGVLKKVEGQSSAKEERLTELRRKRQIEDMALMKRISKIGKEEPSEKGGTQDYERIETSIDKLFELVQKNKRIRISDALAHKLGTTRAKIESWAMILEEHNLVELHYSAMGEPEIREKGLVEGKG